MQETRKGKMDELENKKRKSERVERREVKGNKEKGK